MALISPKGLYYNLNYITPEFERELMEEIYSREWKHVLKRRTQHYVHYYDYNTPLLKREAQPMPPKIKELADHLVRNGVLSKMSDQVLINEYDQKKGISTHSDHSQFGGEIVSISLWAPTIMNFSNKDSGANFPVILEPRSMTLMTGEARYKWTHSVDEHVNISLGDWSYEKPANYKRVSVTYRYYV